MEDYIDGNLSRISSSNFFSSVERLPERRRTIEDMSIQDWAQKVQRFQRQNQKLEKELELLQHQYDHVYEQKEMIRLKAKELTETVSEIYQRYEELEKLVETKDQEILRLNQNIQHLENNLREVKSSPASIATTFRVRSPERSELPQNHDHPRFHPEYMNSSNTIFTATTTTTTSTNTVLVSPDRSQEEKIAELSLILSQYQERERSSTEENAKLHARVVELEGTLSGTLYHSAYKGSSQRGELIIPPSAEKTTRADVLHLVDALQTAALSSSKTGTPYRLRSNHSKAPGILLQSTSDDVNEEDHHDRLIYHAE